MDVNNSDWEEACGLTLLATKLVRAVIRERSINGDCLRRKKAHRKDNGNGHTCTSRAYETFVVVARKEIQQASDMNTRT